MIACCLLAFTATGTARTIRPTYAPPADRALAVEWLGELKSQTALPVLIELCADPDGGVRYSAVMALEKLNDTRAIDIFTKLSDDSSQDRVKGTVLFDSARNHFLDMGGGGSTRDYSVRYTAQCALMRFSAARPDLPPVKPLKIIADLHSSLPVDPADFARYDRRAWGAHADLAYRETEECKRFDRLYGNCYQDIEILALAKRGSATAHALAEVLGCGEENLELNTGRALSRRDDKSEVLALVHPILERRDLSPLTLSACLMITLSQEPGGSRALAQRLLARMATADDHEWERGEFITFPVLREALTSEDIAAVDALRDAQTDPARRAMVDGLARRLAGGPPPDEELLNLEDVTLLPDDRRKEATAVFLRELNKPQSDWATFKAAYQLGRLRAPEAVPGLLHLLDFPGWGNFVAFRGTASYYQTMAGWALTQIGDPACLPRLKEIAQSEVRADAGKYPTLAAALLAYGRLGGDAAVEDLAAVLMQSSHNRFASVAHNMGIAERAKSREARDGDPPLAFENYNTCQDAAAYALSRIGSTRARAVLTRYLAEVEKGRILTADIAEAIFQVAPDELDEWSPRTLDADLPWDHNSLRGTAVAVRLGFFTASTTKLVESILQDVNHPLHWSVVYFLRSRRWRTEWSSRLWRSGLNCPSSHLQTIGRAHLSVVWN